MNKGFGQYYKGSFGAAYRCLYKKRGNFFRYYAYIFMELLSLIFFPIRPITKGLNYQIANDANEGRSIALSLGGKNVVSGKTYWSILVALFYKAFIIIGIVLAALIPAGLLFGIAYGVYAYFYYAGKGMPIILIIGSIPAGLVLLVSVLYIPIRTVPVGFINNKNPNIDAARCVFISFDALKKEGKFTLFLIHFVSILLTVLILALIGVPILLYNLKVITANLFYLVPITMVGIAIPVLVFLPLFILVAQCSKERLFYDLIQNPQDFKKDLENIVFKRDRNLSTANALVKNFNDVVDEDKLHMEKVKVKIKNYDVIEDEEIEEIVSKKEKLQRVKEQKALQKDYKNREVKQIFDDEPNPEEGKDVEPVVEETAFEEAAPEEVSTQPAMEEPEVLEQTLEEQVEETKEVAEPEAMEPQVELDEQPTLETETPEEVQEETEVVEEDAEPEAVEPEVSEPEESEAVPASEPEPVTEEPEANEEAQEEPTEEPTLEEPEEVVESEPVVEETKEPEEVEPEPTSEAMEEPAIEEAKPAKARVVAKKPATKTTEKKTATKSTTTKTAEKKTTAKAKEEKPKATTKAAEKKTTATKAATKPAEKKTTTTKTTAKPKATATKAKAETKEEPKKSNIKVIKAKPKK